MPKRILDIGAYRGAWSEVVWHTWPDAEYWLIEANLDCAEHLEKTGFDYCIRLLGKEIKKVNYYKCQTGSGEGNSIYKEQTHYPFKEEEVWMTTLDHTANTRVFNPPIPSYDLIKIDAQGAELDIINGGVETIQKAHIVQLECQIQNYNAGAPLMIDVINRMAELGFRVYVIGEYHYNSLNMLIQADLIFVQKNSPLFAVTNLS
ncbi:hypothetical protein E3A20_20720 [Planctomyces bekefii]|uniref:Methyltransferase FkbM domain-containing protein n=1 Tax=Planctomyces bekefii TaxID=1653850 RepID=A0A5C6M6X9_9PLAN|nr:hypothetical protein E3A20_20720 [Planctomyces bekefii]